MITKPFMKKLFRFPAPCLPIFLCLFLGTPLSNLSAQSYGTAVGGRLGTGWGLTLQQQVAVHTTVEAILQSGFTSTETTFSILGEQHQSLISSHFNFYFGGGFYKTWLETNTNLKVQPANPIGISGIAGLELTFGKLNFSADFKPMIRLSGGDSSTKGFQGQPGISIRYVFADRYFKDESWKFWQKWTKPKRKK
jgi:hypothetical protein